MIYLVGTGVGRRGLLTCRAAEVIACAELVLPERGVGEEVLALAAHAEILSARGGAEEVVSALASAADGAVVRLYVGDVLGGERGAAEAALLTARGLEYEVVPGLPPELVAAAYAGVGVSAGEGLAVVRVEGGAGEAGSVLSVGRAGDVQSAAGALLGAGTAPDTPALLVSRPGGSSQQARVVELPRLAAGEATGEAASESTAEACVLLASPGVATRSAWFEARPLFGKRVVVTRPRAQAGSFVAWLEAQGAEAVPFPAIRIVPPPDPEPLAHAVASLREFDWVVLTSVNGVERLWQAMLAANLDARALGRARLAAIGPATAEALGRVGLRPDVVPERYVAESVLEALRATGPLEGVRVLLARAHGARDVLPRGLEALGARVTEVEAYRAVPDEAGGQELRLRLAQGQIDAVTFTSSSTVRNFVDAVGAALGRAVVACIGPVTADTARDAGLPVHITASEHTVAGLEAALAAHFRGSRQAHEDPRDPRTRR